MLLRWQKQSRYFTVSVYQDLVGDWILTQTWGDSQSDESEFMHCVLPSLQDAETQLHKIRLGLIRQGYQEDAKQISPESIYEQI
ncbi:hypothetical protein [Nitrincola tapanii]|uniref:WGR domain-containing protein n=1 Tax=Nitrincola tapanii TaxID=1708751 RepID=A0A5A9W4Q7_9GAMM|nr:hypothetical protein [Nitrincola tapanii]KAA0875058.1 hypothetical protein E1H14_06465 [Nitrincola tapanii]